MRRPHGIKEYQDHSGFMTDESLARAQAYRPAATDIFIAPYAKCGTTWMQQIVHGLRSGGSMEFEEITEVIPWIELAYDMGVDVNAEQVASPRAFKSHLPAHDLPTGGKYIVVFRDPVDALVSLFRFMEGWFFETGTVTLHEFAEDYLERGSESYWCHAMSWFDLRDSETVLLLCYEDMKLDLPGTVDRVADFMDAGFGPERRALATRQASFSFMKDYADRFDDSLVHRTRDAACGLPPDGVSTKVDSARANVDVSDDIRKAMDLKWRDTLGSEFGLQDYEALRTAVNAL